MVTLPVKTTGAMTLSTTVMQSVPNNSVNTNVLLHQLNPTESILFRQQPTQEKRNESLCIFRGYHCSASIINKYFLNVSFAINVFVLKIHLHKLLFWTLYSQKRTLQMIMYVCMYVCMHAYMCVYVYMDGCMHGCMDGCMNTRMPA